VRQEQQAEGEAGQTGDDADQDGGDQGGDAQLEHDGLPPEAADGAARQCA
jgi:hypothetical protein